MSSPFDASTVGTAVDDAPATTATAFEPGDGGPPQSLLDQLRERVEERNEDLGEEWFREIPKLGIRLVCDPNIEAEDYQRWMRAARAKRKGAARGADLMDLSQFQLSVRGLVASNLRLEIKRGDKWEPMRSGSGETYTLESRELMQAFNVVDPGALLSKLFGRDGFVINAGQALFTEAGLIGDDDDNPE